MAGAMAAIGRRAVARAPAALPQGPGPLRAAAGVVAARRFAAGTPIVELREYQLSCAGVPDFVTAASERSALIRETTPLRLLSLPTAGGPLNVATHFYAYGGGHAERDAGLAAKRNDPRWREFQHSIAPGVQQQCSLLFVEAPLVGDFNLHGLMDASCPGGEPADGAIYELRRYQLQLGYDTVPRFLKLFAQGLPSKLEAPGTDPSTSLVSLIYSDVGSLNEVIELWRHGGGTSAMETSRKAARAAAEWRAAVAEIAGLAVRFTTAIHEPLEGSPWR